MQSLPASNLSLSPLAVRLGAAYQDSLWSLNISLSHTPTAETTTNSSPVYLPPPPPSFSFCAKYRLQALWGRDPSPSTCHRPVRHLLVYVGVWRPPLQFGCPAGLADLQSLCSGNPTNPGLLVALILTHRWVFLLGDVIWFGAPRGQWKGGTGI